MELAKLERWSWAMLGCARELAGQTSELPEPEPSRSDRDGAPRWEVPDIDHLRVTMPMKKNPQYSA